MVHSTFLYSFNLFCSYHCVINGDGFSFFLFFPTFSYFSDFFDVWRTLLLISRTTSDSLVDNDIEANDDDDFNEEIHIQVSQFAFD